MFKKKLYGCMDDQQGNAQNPSSQASTLREPRTSKCTSWIQKRHLEEQEIKLWDLIRCQWSLNVLEQGCERKYGNVSIFENVSTWKGKEINYIP